MHQIKENVCFLSTLYILRKGTSYLDFFFQGLVTMNTYSRGHVFFVQPCGFIRFWAPLYRSESPTQVSLCIIKYCDLLWTLISWNLRINFYFELICHAALILFSFCIFIWLCWLTFRTGLFNYDSTLALGIATISWYDINVVNWIW